LSKFDAILNCPSELQLYCSLLATTTSIHQLGVHRDELEVQLFTFGNR